VFYTHQELADEPAEERAYSPLSVIRGFVLTLVNIM